MANLFDALVDSVLPNINPDIKKNISNLITDTISDPKNGFKKHLLKFFLEDFSQKEDGTKAGTIEDVLKNKFGISKEDYQKIKEMGLDIFELFNQRYMGANPLNSAIKKSPFSYIEVYGAIIAAILKYGLKKEVEDSFNSPENTGRVAFLIERLTDLQDEAGQNGNETDFIHYLTELIRLFSADSNKDGSSAKIIELLKDEEFKKFLLSRNEQGELNLIHLRKPNTDEILSLFKNFTMSLSKEETPTTFNTGAAEDQTVLGIECKLIRNAKDLDHLLIQTQAQPQHIEQIKKSGQNGDFLILYICLINNMHGLILIGKGAETDWEVEEVITVDTHTQQKINSELHGAIAAGLCSKLN